MILSTEKYKIDFDYHKINKRYVGKKYLLVWDLSSKMCILHEHNLEDCDVIRIIKEYGVN